MKNKTTRLFNSLLNKSQQKVVKAKDLKAAFEDAGAEIEEQPDANAFSVTFGKFSTSVSYIDIGKKHCREPKTIPVREMVRAMLSAQRA